MSEEIKQVGTVDITPTWQTATRIFMETLEHGETVEGKDSARGELMRMARIADNAVAAAKREPVAFLCVAKDGGRHLVHAGESEPTRWVSVTPLYEGATHGG